MVYDVKVDDVTCRFILDGYPLTRHQVDLMTQRAIIPVRVIELSLNSKEVVTRATKDRYSPERTLPLHDSAQNLTIKLAAWQKEVSSHHVVMCSSVYYYMSAKRCWTTVCWCC